MSYPVFYPIEGDVLPIMFDTFAGSTGASVTMSGLAVTDIEIYKDGSVTQRSSDAGYALLDTDGIDFDGLTGIHGFSIDLSDNTDAGFFSVGPWYHVVVSAITIDSQAVSFIAAAFRIVSATRGLAGTALPNAAADAAGGLPISDAGGLDLDSQIGTKINSILDDTGTSGVVLANDAITAAKFDESTAFPLTAVNGSTLTEAGGTGDHLTALGTAAELAKVPKSDSNVTWNATALASINAEADAAIETYHLDHLLAATYDPASKPGAADALLNELVENDGGVSRYTVNALENGPSGSGASAEAIADEVETRFPANFDALGINASGHVSRVVLVDTTTTNTDMRGTDSAATATALSAVSVQLVDILSLVEGIAITGSATYIASSSSTLVTGSLSLGTYEDTTAANGIYHVHTDTAGAIEVIYDFEMGASEVGVEVLFRGRVDGANDTILVQVYDWVGTTWDTLWSQAGTGGTTDTNRAEPILAKHTGTNGNDGEVRIRFYAASGLSSATLYVDQLLVAKTVTEFNLTSTALTAINAQVDTALADYDGPTNAEMEARTLAAAAYFDPATDTVANVTTVGSVTTKTGYSLASTGLDSISTTAPSGVASNFREMLVQVWRRFFKRAVLDTDDNEIRTYADNGTTVLTTQVVSDDGTTQDQGAAT